MSVQSNVIGPRGALVLFFFYFVLAFVVHQPGFQSPMIYDSASLVQSNDASFASSLREAIGIFPSRPLYMTYLYVIFRFAGMDPYVFRTCNAAVLSAAGVVLALLLSMILRLDGRQDLQQEGWTSAVPMFLGLLFVVHPLQTFVVLYVWQGQAILVCLFYFSAIALYLSVRSSNASGTVAGLSVVGALFLAGLATKENMITLPVALLLVEVLFFPAGVKGALKKATTLAAVSLPPLCIYLFLTWGLYGAHSRHSEGALNSILTYYRMGDLNLVSILLTESRVIFSYILSVLIPFWVPPRLIEAQVVSASLWNPPVSAATAAGVLVLLSLAVRYRRTRPVECFGILFFFIALIPEAVLIPQYLYFGYRPILSMAGILLIVGQLLGSFLNTWNKQPRGYRIALVVVCSLLVGSFSFQSYQQATRWNPAAFWSDAYARLPRLSDRVEQKPYWDVVVNYGQQLLQEGRPLECISVLTKDLATMPEMEPVMAAIGKSRQKPEMGNPPAAERARERVRIPAALLANLGLALKKSGKTQEASNVYAITCNDLGMAFQQNRDLKSALEQYRLAVSLRPDFPEALYNLGNALREAGDLAQSGEYLRRAAELRPRNVDGLQSLGYTLLISGRFAAAADAFRKIIEIDPKDAVAHNALAVALAKQGETEQARAEFMKALDLDPGNAEIQRNLDSLPPAAQPSKQGE